MLKKLLTALTKKNLDAALEEQNSNAITKTHSALEYTLSEILRHCPDGKLIYIARNRGWDNVNHEESIKTLLLGISPVDKWCCERGSERTLLNPSNVASYTTSYLIDQFWSYGVYPGDCFTKWEYVETPW